MPCGQRMGSWWSARMARRSTSRPPHRAQAQDDYLSYYGRIDVWTPPPFALPGLRHHADSQNGFRTACVLNSEFYRDYARHLDMWHPVGLTCTLGPDLSLMIGLNRTRTGRDFSNAEYGRLIDLSHHVQRALKCAATCKAWKTKPAPDMPFLMRLPSRLWSPTWTAESHFANTKAEELERSGCRSDLERCVGSGPPTASRAASCRTYT